MADENLMKVKIITPDRIFYEGEASFVEMVTSEGEVGIYKNHIPMTMILVPGIISITEADGMKYAALHAGFVEILQDSIIVMAEVAEWPEEIDLQRAEEAKIRAERRLGDSDENINTRRAELALRRSLARIELTKR